MRENKTNYHLAKINSTILNINATIPLMKKVVIKSVTQIEICADWLTGAMIDEIDNVVDYEVTFLSGNLLIHCKKS